MLILFDCDGTLVDSHHQIINSMQHAFRDVSQTAPSTKQVAHIIGLSLHEAIGHLGTSLSKIQRDHIATRYRVHFNQGSSTLFPHAHDVLTTLQSCGHDMGIVTGKSMSGLQQVLEQHHLKKYFLVMRTADCCPSKPHPAMVQESMAEMGADPTQTYVIGDATFDIQMAVSAGTKGIGIPTGSHDEAALHHAGAYCVVKNLNELLHVFEGQQINA